MRALLPVAALALAAVTVPAHAGCVDDLVGHPSVPPVVTIDPDGRIIVDPNAVPDQVALGPKVAAFVSCVK